MDVSEDAGEPNKDFNSSTSENQQTNAPTSCQASLPAGDKAAGQPVSRRFARVQKTILRRTRHRRHKRRRRKPSRKILRTFARDGRKPSLEDCHLLNVEPSTSDPEQEEEVTPSTSVSASD